MAGSSDEKLSASLEDYLEAILHLSGDDGKVRSKDIAQRLGVSRASVTGALRLLKSKELANYKPYGCATLTEAGHAAAAEVAKKHQVLKSFFIDVLGVDADIAQNAACRAEHTLGPIVIGRLPLFSEFVTRKDADGENLAAEFCRFCRHNSATHDVNTCV